LKKYVTRKYLLKPAQEEVMRQLTTLGVVQEKVEALSRRYWDEFIPTRQVSFLDLTTVKINLDYYGLRPLAQKALATRYGIPFSYLQKCPPEVQAYNLNHWLQTETNDQLFFRFDGQEVRAVFTPRYKPVDNGEVLKQLTNLGLSPDTKVQCRLDGEFMLLNIPDGRKTFSLNGLDRVTPGISLANSEVGLSSLRISAFFLRLQCTNGLIAETSVTSHYRHVSHKILAEFPRIIAEVSSHLSQQQNKFTLSLESPVEDPLATIKSFNRQFQLAQTEQEAVEWGYGYEPGFTMFHIVNAYTRAAGKSQLTAESSYRLQKVGGTILAMVR
jgi:hypothetical protein